VSRQLKNEIDQVQVRNVWSWHVLALQTRMCERNNGLFYIVH
jgi:hypothetical protein